MDTENSTTPLTPVGIWPGPLTGSAALTPQPWLSYVSQQAGRSWCLYGKGRRSWEEGDFYPLFIPSFLSHQEEKGICLTADFSYSVMLLTGGEPGTPLLGTPLHEDSVFPFKLEGMSVLWPPQPHIFHCKVMTSEAPFGEQGHESLGKRKSLLRTSLENSC